MYITLLFFIFLAIGFSFYCSVAEAVLLSISPSFIRTLRESRPKDAERLSELKSNIDRPLAAILSLNTIAHTVGAAGVGAQAVAIWGGTSLGPDTVLAIAGAVMTFLILIFSEIIPKTIGALYWRKLGPFVAITVRWLIKLLFPLVWISEKLTKILSGGKSHHTLTREELGAMAEIGAQQGILGQSESKFFNALIRFPEVKVKDVMTPRVVVVAFDQSMTVKELFEKLPELPTSRIPIFNETLDHATGFVLKVDLLLAQGEGRQNEPLSAFKRDLLSVTDESPLPEVLETLLADRHHIAIVVGQFGAVRGVVTMEDIVETLLGLEIVDEHDTEVDMQQFAPRPLARTREEDWFGSRFGERQVAVVYGELLISLNRKDIWVTGNSPQTLLHRCDQGSAKRGQIIGASTGDVVTVDDHFGVFIDRPCVHQVVLDPRRSGDFHVAVDTCGNRYPATVANRGDRLLRCIKRFHQIEHDRVTTKLVGHETTGNDQSLEIGFVHLVQRGIARARVTVLAVVVGVGFWPGDRHRSAGLFHTKLGIPQLEVFIDFANDDQHSLIGQR